MTETPLDMFDSAWIGPVLLLLNQYFVITEKETLLLWICIVSREERREELWLGGGPG